MNNYFVFVNILVAVLLNIFAHIVLTEEAVMLATQEDCEIVKLLHRQHMVHVSLIYILGLKFATSK